jgi:AraC-like DNA-binding protein
MGTLSLARSRGSRNDRDPSIPDRNATLPSTTDGVGAPAEASFDAALAALRLDGAIFFRSEFSEGWSYESPPATAEFAGQLRPGAQRLIIFHIVARGSCWISLLDDERHHASAGDVIVLPYGDPHRMGGREPAACVPIFSLLDPPPWDALPVLRHGDGGARTDIVCGYLYSDHPLFDPALRALPSVFVVHPPEGPAARWVASSIEYALELSSSTTSPIGGAPTRLPELLLIEVLRLHLATAPGSAPGWLSALHDPVLAPALARLHTEPDRKWTVAELAASASVSRSLLDGRFREVLGRAPIRYLTDWRMHVAEDLLRDTDESVARIGRRVGYDSEEAFSRAFKRSHGDAPSLWRTARRPPATSLHVRPRP